MTGVVNVDEKLVEEVTSRKKYIVDWTSHTDGTVVSDPIYAVGYITEIERVPGAKGDLATDCPDGSYNIKIKDPYGADLIATANDGSATAAQRTLQTTPMWVDDYMTVNITAAGSTNQGRLIIWVQRSVNG